ncbi:MAG: hypothetical protein KDI22_09710 [Gammaproteobacteria bacterium]|nr:hypothetical protein [Gammaproteobacteria bacterium]MCB1818094.1 hypothetical protein [Gammaproteobacteria bacterium]HOP16987.1 hypothetical protein [Gammaproteobacteria bacterium]
MKRNRGFSFIERLVLGRPNAAAPGPVASVSEETGQVPGASGSERVLTGSELEQAYRNLLVENMVLVESNARLHDRLSRRDSGLEESPAAKQLIRAQRDALAERSHRLRELEYENKRLIREQKKQAEERDRLAGELKRALRDVEPLRRQVDTYRRELGDVKAELRDKNNELLKITDRYYQMEARNRPQQPPPSAAANGDF